jgi:hypothetical protein
MLDGRNRDPTRREEGRHAPYRRAGGGAESGKGRHFLPPCGKVFPSDGPIGASTGTGALLPRIPSRAGLTVPVEDRDPEAQDGPVGLELPPRIVGRPKLVFVADPQLRSLGRTLLDVDGGGPTDLLGG